MDSFSNKLFAKSKTSKNSDALTNDFLLELTTNAMIDDVEATSFKELFEYQGFNIFAILGEMHKLAGETKFLIRDVTALISLVLLRGTNVNLIMSRISKDASDVVSDLITKYKIQTVKNNKDMRSDTITLPRIVNCFPKIASQLAERGFFREARTVNGMKNKYKFYGASAIIDNEEDFNKYLEWAIINTKVMNSKSKGADVLKFTKIARMNSKFLKNPAHIKVTLDSSFFEGEDPNLIA